jgi:6-phosphogluconolactonase
LISFVTQEQLAEAVAGEWLQQLSSAVPAKARYPVALSGGRIARQFYSAIARANSQRHALDAVEFFWGDERCVPPDDPESNFAIANELLFVPLNIPDTHIHRIHGEAPPESAAGQAEAELLEIAPRNDTGQPVLDLIFLGMGEDGHVASLFPEEPEEVRESNAVFRVVTAVKPPPRRITLGYAAIAAARQVWVLASGKGKEIALRNSLDPAGQTPLARVLRQRFHTRIFTDIQVKARS